MTAIYARVSTKLQSPAMQLDQLRAYALARGWPITQEFVDFQTGSRESRPQLNQMMDLIRKGKIHRVLVWKFDRFARSSRHLVTVLEEFQRRNVDFISYTENIDTSTPMGRAMFAIIAAMAQLERDLICERVQAGVTRARARGIVWGRRRIAVQPIPAGLSLRDAALKLGVSHETIRRRRNAQ